MLEGYNNLVAFLRSGPTLEELKQHLPGEEKWRRHYWSIYYHMLYVHPTRSLTEAIALVTWFRQVHADGGSAASIYGPLFVAARAYSLTLIKALVHCGEDVNAVHSGSGATILDSALSEPHYDPKASEKESVVIYLVDKGVKTTRTVLPDYALEFVEHKSALRKSCILLLAIGRSRQSPILRRYTDRGILGLIARELWMLRFSC